VPRAPAPATPQSLADIQRAQEAAKSAAPAVALRCTSNAWGLVGAARRDTAAGAAPPPPPDAPDRPRPAWPVTPPPKARY